MADILFSDFSAQNIRSGTDIIQTSGRDTIGKAPGRYINDVLATAALFTAHPRFVGKSSNNRYFRALPETGLIAAELSGSVGDGIADDGPAIRAAHAYAAAIGARGVRFGQARLRLEAMTPAESGQPLGAQPNLQLGVGPAVYDWGGAEFIRQNPGRGTLYDPRFTNGVIELPLTADVAAGDRTVRLSAGDAAQLAPGNSIMWQLGEIPYDTPETFNWDFANVTSVAGEFVTLDKPIPKGLVLSSVTGANKRLRKFTPMHDVVLRDMTITATNIESGIDLYGAKRVTLERIGGRNLGAGLLVAQYCDGLTVADCWQEGVVLSAASFGAAFSFAECRNVLLTRPHAKGLLGLVKAEAGAEVTVIGGHFENTMTDPGGQSFGTAVRVINAMGRGSVALHDLTVTGFGGYNLAETENGQTGYEGAVTLTGITRLRHPDMPFALPIPGMSGTLDMEIAGQRELHDFARLRQWKRRFALRDGEYLFAFGPPGILVRASCYTTPGLTVGVGGQLAGLWLGRSGSNGSNLAGGSAFGQLVPGSEINVRIYGGLVAGALWDLRNSPLQLLCVTAAGAGLNAANGFVEFEGWFATRTDLTGFSMAEEDWRAAGADREVHEALFAAYDLPTIAAGASLTVDLAIPAMLAGDFVEAVRMTGGFGGLTITAFEARAASLRLVFINPGTAAIDRAATDLAVTFARAQLGS